MCALIMLNVHFSFPYAHCFIARAEGLIYLQHELYMGGGSIQGKNDCIKSFH